MKKFLIAGISLFAIAGFVATASAQDPFWMGDWHSKVWVGNNNNADIETNTLTVSNTGMNVADADSSTGGFPLAFDLVGGSGGSSRAMGGDVVTGDADAHSGIGIAANGNETMVSNDGATTGGDVHLQTDVENNNNADIETNTLTVANSGLNSASAISTSGEGSSRARGGAIRTGDAMAMTEIGIIANSNVTHISN